MTCAIVFLSGTLCDERLFAPQIAALTGGGNDIHTPPMDGHAGGLAAFAAALLAALPRRFAVVGLSLGGIVALEMMRQAAERICCAALLDANANADADAARAAREQDFNQAAEIGLETFIREVMLPRQLHADNLRDAALCQTMTDMALSAGAGRWRRQLALIAHRRAAYDVLAAYPQPLLIGCGSDDKICPPAAHAQMAAAARQAELAEFPASGHISTLENPPAVTQALLAFLTQNGVITL